MIKEMTRGLLRLHKLHISATLRWLALLVLLLSAPTVCFGAAAPKPMAPAAPAPAVAATTSLPVIAVTDVAARAMDVSNLLRSITAKLGTSQEIETIQKYLPVANAASTAEAARTLKILQDEPPLEMLQTQQLLWQGMQHQRSLWLNAVTARVTQIQEALTELANLQKTWTLTRAAAQASKAPAPVLQQINGTISALEGAQGPLQAQRAVLLDLQNSVADELARCENALVQIAQAQQTAVGGILTRHSPPIWSGDPLARLKALGALIPKFASSCWDDLREYVSRPSKGLPSHMGIFIVLALILCAARRRLDQWTADGETTSSAAMIFERPYAAALVGAMLAGAGTYSQSPPMVRMLFEIAALAPMIRLIRPMVDPSLLFGIYMLVILFAVDTVRQALSGGMLSGQAILVLEAIAGIVGLRFLHLRRVRSSAAPQKGPSWSRVIEILYRLFLFILSAGLVAAALGYMALARLLVPGVLAGGTLALTLYALLQVFRGALVFTFRVWPLRLLEMVQHHRSLLEQRIYRWMVWVSVITWISRYLDYVGLLQPTLSQISGLLALKLERGAISTSLGDILAFILVVWASYLLSKFIRFVLQEDVYPRIGVPKGMSYATSSLIHYILLAIGVVVGIGVLGVKLTQVSVLAGAFGVGIGFGLQSVINNFVSGVILLFERPVHVGDTIQIGDLVGTIRRIGIRASIVHTAQGADIIVPNSQFVSDKVTNWTLSDQLRRVDLPVGVNYGAVPQEVIKLLEGVAAANPQILRHPPPLAFFVGYGDSTINFELRVWTDQFDRWMQIRSDLTVAVYEAVLKAGMSFPFPQREIRLLNDTEGETRGVKAK